MRESLLIYMSIDRQIRESDIGGRLVELPPMEPGPHPRWLYVTQGLLHDMASAGDAEGLRIGMLRRDFDRFTGGHPITVGYGRERTCFMKPLDPRGDEVWEIRSRSPKPALRVFGRFFACDRFIATHWAWRRTLAEEYAAWPREISNCKALWRKIFPTQAAYGGSTIGDYISSNVVELPLGT